MTFSSKTLPVSLDPTFGTIRIGTDLIFTCASKEIDESAKKSGMIALKVLSFKELLNSFEELVKEGKLIRLNAEPKVLPSGKQIRLLFYIYPPEGLADWNTYLQSARTPSPLLFVQTNAQEAGKTVCFKHTVNCQRVITHEKLLKNNATDADKLLIQKRAAMWEKGLKAHQGVLEELRASIAVAKAAGLDKVDYKTDHKNQNIDDKKR